MSTPHSQAFVIESSPGMTKREYFAAQALVGFAASGSNPTDSAVDAVKAADELIARLNANRTDGPDPVVVALQTEISRLRAVIAHDRTPIIGDVE